MAQALFILGMHRSGTSALARVVNLLGAELGSDLMQAADDNEKGFFEHEGAVVIHEALLTSLHLRWCDFLPLPEGWQSSAEAKDASGELTALIERDFAGAPLWAIKDPRMSRLFPLWKPLVEKRDMKPLALVTWRNPLEVAASLKKRDGMAESNALLCWLAYTLEGLRHAQGLPMAIVSYDALMENWQGTMEHAAQSLGIEWPRTPAAAKAEVEQFLTPSLRHHTRQMQWGDSPIHHMARRTVALLEEYDEAACHVLLDDWAEYCARVQEAAQWPSQEASRLSKAYAEVTKERDDHAHAIQDLKQQLVELWQRIHKTEEDHKVAMNEAMMRERNALHALQEVKEELRNVYDSTSWKVTEPLRAVNARLHRSKDQAKEQSHD